jgi:4-hydroxybenzoate polyprenyltransferase
MINYGCIITPYCVLGHSAPSVTLPLYAAFAGWTVAYDTLYAHQDKEDDKRLNLGSTAIAFGEVSRGG